MNEPDFEPVARRALEHAWRELGARAEQLSQLVFAPAERALCSFYEVSAFASACVGTATLAVAEWLEHAAGGPPRRAYVDARHAAMAFMSERLLTPLGWQLPNAWDALAGDYRTADGFIRLHTNYAHHRRAALAVLDVAPERNAIARALAARSADEVEQAIVAADGCAAAMRSEADWSRHPAGRAIAAEPLIALELTPGPDGASQARGYATRDGARPLAGVRVLDLTRVIAGPVATRFLAAYGADVLRVDPPGFEEVPALVPETTFGKRCTALDLNAAADRARFEALLASADVLVCGLRSNALAALGYDREKLRAGNQGLILAQLDAYGFNGPWAERRGFDSLVQMSSGIAERGMRAAAADHPVPLPVQALDHGSGYLLAAAIVRALSRRSSEGSTTQLRLSLARTALFLRSLGVAETPSGEELAPEARAAFLEGAPSAWGPLRRVRCPGAIDGAVPEWSIASAPLGTAPPVWSSA